MVFHTVAVFSIRHGVEDAALSGFENALRVFAESCESLIDFSCGRDLRLRPGTDDFAVHAVFDSVDSLSAYLHHPEHGKIAATLAAPLFGAKHNVQFQENDATVVDDRA